MQQYTEAIRSSLDRYPHPSHDLLLLEHARMQRIYPRIFAFHLEAGYQTNAPYGDAATDSSRNEINSHLISYVDGLVFDMACIGRMDHHVVRN